MIKKYRKKPIVIEAVCFDATKKSVEYIKKLNASGERDVIEKYLDGADSPII